MFLCFLYIEWASSFSDFFFPRLVNWFLFLKFRGGLFSPSKQVLQKSYFLLFCFRSFYCTVEKLHGLVDWNGQLRCLLCINLQSAYVWMHSISGVLKYLHFLTDLWEFYLPYLYSCISLMGCLLLLCKYFSDIILMLKQSCSVFWKIMGKFPDEILLTAWRFFFFFKLALNFFCMFKINFDTLKPWTNKIPLVFSKESLLQGVGERTGGRQSDPLPSSPCCPRPGPSTALCLWAVTVKFCVMHLWSSFPSHSVSLHVKRHVASQQRSKQMSAGKTASAYGRRSQLVSSDAWNAACFWLVFFDFFEGSWTLASPAPPWSSQVSLKCKSAHPPRASPQSFSSGDTEEPGQARRKPRLATRASARQRPSSRSPQARGLPWLWRKLSLFRSVHSGRPLPHVHCHGAAVGEASSEYVVVKRLVR